MSESEKIGNLFANRLRAETILKSDAAIAFNPKQNIGVAVKLISSVDKELFLAAPAVALFDERDGELVLVHEDVLPQEELLMDWFEGAVHGDKIFHTFFHGAEERTGKHAEVSGPEQNLFDWAEFQKMRAKKGQPSLTPVRDWIKKHKIKTEDFQEATERGLAALEAGATYEEWDKLRTREYERQFGQ